MLPPPTHVFVLHLFPWFHNREFLIVKYVRMHQKCVCTHGFSSIDRFSTTWYSPVHPEELFGGISMSTDRLIADLYFGDSMLMLLLAGRLWHLGLQKRLPWFLSSLILDLAVGYSGIVTGFRSRTYCVIFGVSEPLALLTLLFMTKEVFADLHEVYPGLRIMARRTFYGSLGVGLLCAGLGMSATHTVWHYPAFQCIFFLFVEFKRFVSIGLVVFTLTMLTRLSVMPITMSRNTRTHGIVYSASLTSVVITSIFVLLKHDHTSIWWCNFCLQIAAIGCHCAWLALLRREPAAVGGTVPISDEEAIVGSLRRFNEVLLLIYPERKGAESRARWLMSLTKDVFSRSFLGE
jgi:hypothetical protein